jgi:diguanylate cyclase (GGDEF)-like protein/PAS domain S-box-containing protein
MPLEMPFDPATVEDVARQLLSQHPDAAVCAMDVGAQFVPVPGGLCAVGHPVLSATSAFEMVVPDDLALLVDAWDRCRRVGGSRVGLRRAPDGEPVTVHMFDLMSAYGVCFVVFVAGQGSGSPAFDPRAAVEQRPRLCTVCKNDVSTIVEVDEATTKMLGWQRADIVGQRSLELIHPDDQHRAIDNWLQMLASPGRGFRWRGRHRCADGTYRWIEFTNTNHLTDPARRCVVGELVDVSDEMAAHEAVRVREQMLVQLAAALPVGVIQFDCDGRITFSNDQLRDVLGGASGERLSDQFANVSDDDRDLLNAVIAGALAGESVDEIELRVDSTGSEQPRICQLSLRPLYGPDGKATGVIGCVSDVTDQVRMRRDLEARATYDELTGCLNRAATMNVLDLMIAGPSSVGVIFVDIDDFKSINDRLSHAAGDQLLQLVARRLRHGIRDGDVVGRIGGDEFLVVCASADSATSTVAVATRLSSAMSDPAVVDGHPIAVTASFGVAFAEPGDPARHNLVALADAAMYESKRGTCGQPVLAAASS